MCWPDSGYSKRLDNHTGPDPEGIRAGLSEEGADAFRADRLTIWIKIEI